MFKKQARHINLGACRIRHLLLVNLSVALLLTLAGCTLDSRTAVKGVKVTPQTLVFVGTGETKALSATIAPPDATDQVVTWESSDPSVASVDTLGRVTARAVGFDVFVTVRTHDGNYQASCNVQVDP